MVLTVEVDNLDDHNATAVPSSFAPTTQGVRYLVQSGPGADPVVLDVPSPIECPTLLLAPGDTHVREVSLHRWHAFAEGTFTVTLWWTPLGATPLSAAVSLEVVPVETLAFAFAPAAARDAFSEPRGVCAVSSPSLGVVFDRRFSADLEDPFLFTQTVDGARLSCDRAVHRVVAVRPAEAPLGWIVWRDDVGLWARAGGAVEGPACSPWPLQAGTLTLGPAHETADGTLRVWTVRGEPGARCLVETRFAPPVTEVEAPDGPDDWDDEILVAGPVSEHPFAPFGDAEIVAAALVERDDDVVQIVVVAANTGGVTLHGAWLEEAQVRWTFSAVLPGRPMGGASLASYAGPAGETWVAAAFASPDAADPEVIWARVIVARIDDAGTHTEQDAWLGALPSAAVSAALCFSWVDAERPFWRVLVCCEDGSAWLGDRDGQWSSLGAPDLVLPPSLATCRDHAHAAVRGPDGPTLVRLHPLD